MRKKSSALLINNTIIVSVTTLMSKLLGFIRDMLLVRYLGVEATADAFWIAFRIPNLLRKLIAEGALNASLLPSLIKLLKKDGSQAAQMLVSQVLFFFATFTLILCLACIKIAPQLILFMAPGASEEVGAISIPLLRILIFFVWFTACSSILSCALQAVKQFFISALGQIILNIATIIITIIALGKGYPIKTWALFFLGGNLLQLCMFVSIYFFKNFRLFLPSFYLHKEFVLVIRKFIPCLISLSMAEINLFIDAQFASYLPQGSISLITYASNFARMPLGIFIIALSSILLPHFSHIGSRTPKRLGFYLFECTKIIYWVMIPITLLMSFFAYDIFFTLYFSSHFSYEYVIQATYLLIYFSIGIFFSSINKIILTIFHALQETFIPTITTLVGATINSFLIFLLMPTLQIYSIPFATTVSTIFQSCVLIWLLRKKFHIPLYTNTLFLFFRQATVQLAVVGIPLGLIFFIIRSMLYASPAYYAYLLSHTFLLWVWIVPLCLCGALILFLTRKSFGLKLYLLSHYR